MKILVIKPSSLGDVIHSLRVISRVRNAYPKAKIDWVIKNGLQGILDASGMVDRSLIFNRGRGLVDYLRLMAEIRRGNYDFVLDLQGLLRSAVLARFSKGKQIFGVADGREGSVFLYKAVGEKSRSKKTHAIERLLPFLDILKIKESDDNMSLHFDNSFLSQATQKKLNQRSGYLLLFPESRRKEKEWPFFSTLGERLSNLNNEEIVVAGSLRDKGFEKCNDLRGEVKLNELPALIAKAKMVISNDSAPLHIASSLGKPTISFFGPTDPVKYGYYPAKSPMNGLIEAEGKILKRISVERVVEKYQALLERTISEREINQ